jgi:7-keto-8-aminopelargonate synthetase-like enzyme
MQKGLKELGFDTGKTQTPIIPIVIGDTEKAFTFWKVLFEAGVYTNPVCAPAVPAGMDLLRTSYTASQTREQLTRALGIFEKCGKQLGLI